MNRCVKVHKDRICMRWQWWCRECWTGGEHPSNRLGWELALYNGDQHARHGGRG